MKVKIYHNARCSKSRATLEILQAQDADIEIVEYLKSPPGEQEIRTLLALLDKHAADIIRSGETAFRQSGLTVNSPAEELIALMAREPDVIERPIVVAGDAARIGRPPERVLELFD